MAEQILRVLGTILVGLAPIALPFIVFGILERHFPAQRLKSNGGWVFNIKLSMMYLAVPTLLGGVIAGTVAIVRRINGGGLIDLDFDSSASVPVAIAGTFLFLLAFDFFYYWWHRAQHEMKPLWAMHKLHHMDETLGVSTQMRCHWLEEIGRIPFIFVPMALLFNLPLHGGVIAFVLTFWTGLIHSNLRLGFGKASMIVAGPQIHRIHHSNQIQHFDKNYAALFPIYDVIFGTYYHPARDEYPLTGVRGEPEIQSISQAFLLPFRAWSKGMRPRPDEADLPSAYRE
jgi:sterol desaturase/sphingolipid hydroxylase (fatty acid hydroxylase superfamily)